MPQFYPWFVLATVLLMLTPGPNMALIVANSVAYGARYGLLTVAGAAVAVVAHMLLVGFGLAGVLGRIGAVFEWVRWAGVVYLLYLGLRTWRARATDLAVVGAQPRVARTMVVRAVLVSATNPKVLLFYGAFFPQFIAPDRALAPQVWVLCATYLLVMLTVDSLWALGAARARVFLARYGRLRNRVSGGLLVGAGVGLALAQPK